jgi:hypothetical protein
MAALTSQDYKAQRRGSRDTRRLRDFGYGAACGVVLASIAFIFLGARPHSPAAPLRPDAQHPPGVDASGEPGAGKSSEPFTFPDKLPKIEVVIPEQEKHVKRDLPVGRRAQGAAR